MLKSPARMIRGLLWSLVMLMMCALPACRRSLCDGGRLVYRYWRHGGWIKHSMWRGWLKKFHNIKNQKTIFLMNLWTGGPYLEDGDKRRSRYLHVENFNFQSKMEWFKCQTTKEAIDEQSLRTGNFASGVGWFPPKLLRASKNLTIPRSRLMLGLQTCLIQRIPHPLQKPDLLHKKLPASFFDASCSYSTFLFFWCF